MRVIIEPMRSELLDLVHALEQKAFPTAWSRESLAQSADHPRARFFVAGPDSGDGGREIAGFVLSLVAADELHLLKIAVHEDLRRQGIGRQMMEHAIADAAGIGVKYIYLEVRERNLAGQRFYEALGFRLQGIRKVYYTDSGEDAILYMGRIRGES